MPKETVVISTAVEEESPLFEVNVEGEPDQIIVEEDEEMEMDEDLEDIEEDDEEDVDESIDRYKQRSFSECMEEFGVNFLLTSAISEFYNLQDRPFDGLRWFIDHFRKEASSHTVKGKTEQAILQSSLKEDILNEETLQMHLEMDANLLQERLDALEQDTTQHDYVQLIFINKPDDAQNYQIYQNYEKQDARWKIAPNPDILITKSDADILIEGLDENKPQQEEGEEVTEEPIPNADVVLQNTKDIISECQALPYSSFVKGVLRTTRGTRRAEYLKNFFRIQAEKVLPKECEQHFDVKKSSRRTIPPPLQLPPLLCTNFDDDDDEEGEGEEEYPYFSHRSVFSEEGDDGEEDEEEELENELINQMEEIFINESGSKHSVDFPNTPPSTPVAAPGKTSTNKEKKKKTMKSESKASSVRVKPSLTKK